jgi:hypothetical protein
MGEIYTGERPEDVTFLSFQKAPSPKLKRWRQGLYEPGLRSGACPDAASGVDAH